MSVLPDEPDFDEVYDPATLAALRLAADATLLFTICPKARCRRAGCCRGQPLACLIRLTPAVPPPARHCLARLTEAHRDGLDFDDAERECADAIDDLARWRTAVSAGRPQAARFDRSPMATLRTLYRTLDAVPGGLPPLPCWEDD